jgi:hypothetical protein
MEYEYEDDIDDDDLRNAPPWNVWGAPRPGDRRIVRHHGTGSVRPHGGVTVRPRPPTRVIQQPIMPQPVYPTMIMPPRPDYGRVLRLIGVAVDVVGQAVAAFMPLPQAPTGHAAGDTANLTAYQEALAKHAKADERLRTLAKAVREALDLVGRS